VPGLQGQKMLDDRTTAAVANRIAEDESSAAAAGINSTPTFLVRRSATSLEPLQVSALEPSAFRSALDALLTSS